MKKLGFGLMRLPMVGEGETAVIDIEQTKRMVDEFISHGFTYFDTAWMYIGHKSEEATKEFLVDRYPRESFTLATKLHAGFLKTLDDRDLIFNEQLRKTGAGYFDYYLIHDVRRSHYEIYNRLDCFSWVQEKKRQGLVKHVGFSFHDSAEFLDQVLTEHPEMEFVQLQINYLDWESESVQSRKCYEVACKHGVPVIVMEPVKGGTLAKVAAPVEQLLKSHAPQMSVPSWAIRFAASLDNVMMVLSGMSDMAQMQDNISYMENFKPLSDEENALVMRAAEMVRSGIAIPCTSCAYCVEGCPMSIRIPEYFGVYNSKMSPEKQDIAPSYADVAAKGGKASECIACGQCESICPQELPIIENLKIISSYFE